MFILLSANEAGAVRGPSDLDKGRAVPFAALEPVLLKDGRYTLGDEVLSDPAHAKHFAFLSVRPKADLATIASLLPPPPIVAAAPSLGAKVMGALAAAVKWVVG